MTGDDKEGRQTMVILFGPRFSGRRRLALSVLPARRFSWPSSLPR